MHSRPPILDTKTGFKIFKTLVAVIVFSLFFFQATKIFAVTESDCLNKSPSQLSAGEMDECINTILPRIAAAYAPAQEKNKENLTNLKRQIDGLTQRIASISNQLKQTEVEIRERGEDLAYTKAIFDEKARGHYTFLRLYDPITPFLFSDKAADVFQEIVLRQKAADSNRQTMEEYATELSSLKNDRENLEKNKTSLASLQKKVSEDAKFLEGEVAKVDTYLSVVSAKQQEILNAKSGSFMISVGDVELADDYNASIRGFRELAPGGSFAVFSLGGYTHRKGMSQYGAKGRALAGQAYDGILRAYYNFDGYEDRSGITIKVNNGNGVNKGSIIWTGSLDEYVKRIYEVPSSWPEASLQAQAIAARTYALAVTGGGVGTICATQNCQVFKTTPKGGSWDSAVNSTAGKVMVSGGSPIKAYFSSTTGGYLFDKGWDTDGGGGSDLINRAYEAKGGSPWLYKAWYRQGASSSGATCGVGDPWLNNEEFTDIVNAAIVLKSGNDDKIVPTTSCVGGGGGYSYAELRAKGGVNSVSSVVVIQGDGVTTKVTVNGNITLTGLEFKRAFNLRAPGYLRIPQGLGFGSSTDFAFFNIEKK